MDAKYGLFLKRRFLPIFLAQFLGAFNDNLLRSGLAVMIAYAHTRGIELPIASEILVTISSALLIMPFILFSSLAGPIADKYERARLVTITKIAEIGIMLCAFYGFATHNIYLLMIMLFVSGTHSTFFGPIKYSILPDHLRPGELLVGNGFISGSTYIGILMGLIAGGLLVNLDNNIIGYVAVGVACAGTAASLFIPRAEPAHPEAHIDFHPVRGTVQIIRHARSHNSVFMSILGLSWFLMLGSIYMAQFPNYAQGVVHADNKVYTLFLTIFSVGIAAGSVLCDKLLKGEISARYAPHSLLGVTFFTYLLVASTPAPTHEGLLGLTDFLADSRHYLMLFCMLMVAICGGVYMVPLYAILQSKSEAVYRSRIMAASNLCDSLFMTVAAVISALLLSVGLGIMHLFLIAATLNLVVYWYARKILARAAHTPS